MWAGCHAAGRRAFSQLEKARLVAKLKAARDRKIAAGEKCGARHSYAERNQELVALAQQLYRPHAGRRPVSLRKVAAGLAERGYKTPSGKIYSASAVATMIGWGIERYKPPNNASAKFASPL